MSKLREFVSKGVRLIVDDTENPSQPATGEASLSLPPEVFERAEPRRITRSELPTELTDFSAVYKEAGIELPIHGYGVEKVGEMLDSKRLATLAPEVKATAVMAALEAAGVSIKDVIQDAMRRDRALDAFEAQKEKEIKDLKARSEERIQAIKEEIEHFLRDKNAEIEGLKKAADAAAQAFTQLQVRKRREEDHLHEVVAYFVEGAENPITTLRSPSPSSPGNQKPGLL